MVKRALKKAPFSRFGKIIMTIYNIFFYYQIMLIKNWSHPIDKLLLLC